jgi:hypothetical protein
MIDPETLGQPLLAVAGGGGAVWAVKWLVGRAAAGIDDGIERVRQEATSGLLRVTDQLDRLERSHQRHAELLAVVSHELGIRNRTTGKD